MGGDEEKELSWYFKSQIFIPFSWPWFLVPCSLLLGDLRIKTGQPFKDIPCPSVLELAN